MSVKENVAEILKILPAGCTLLAVTKNQNYPQLKEAIEAGVKLLGGNYIQECQRLYPQFNVEKHFIGHLQRNKVKLAVQLFDVIETVDSLLLAAALDRQCIDSGRTISIFIEVNSGREEQKHGVFPEHVKDLAEKISAFSHIRLEGLMTMGPYLEDPESMRPYFKITKEIFDTLNRESTFKLRYLSMGMSNSYRIAIEEGANIIRVGTALFGPRETL